MISFISKHGILLFFFSIISSHVFSQKDSTGYLKGQNFLIDGVEKYRLLVKFSPDVLLDIENGKPLFRKNLLDKIPTDLKTLVDIYHFEQVFSYTAEERKLLKEGKTLLKKSGGFNHLAFRGLAYLKGAENMDKHVVLQLAKEFEKFSFVEYADIEPMVPIPPPSPDLTSYQHYKYDQYTGQNDVYGIDAVYAWSIGITGQGIKIADIETGMDYQHEDLVSPNFIELVATTDHSGDDHGTAVAGIMIAHNNDFGMTGMVYGADKFYGISYAVNGNGRVSGIAEGLKVLDSGDVFVYEMQTFGPPHGDYVPADYDPAVWDITRSASDAGVIVVAAAGNGNVDMDSPYYDSYKARGDNGSIHVGAGTKIGRNKVSFSTYGSVVHLQGWGDESVASTGYNGALYNGGPHATYTNSFSGTSSATAMVASAVVAVQSYAKNVQGVILSPIEMRNLLIQSGTPQGTGGHIGPLPNIRRAIEALQGPNELPMVSISSPENNSTYEAPASVTINVNASDPDGSITKVEFFQGAVKIGEDSTSPYSFTWNNVAAGNYSLTAKAFDNTAAFSVSDTISINVTGASCASTGTILWEYWDNIEGSQVSQIPVNTTPTGSNQLSIFDGPVNFGDHYGSRIRGYICPPVSGNYIFWISADDQCELWLSTDENPANKVKIAYHTGWNTYGEWTKYPTQQSSPISLVAGTKYYIEALQKEHELDDHLSVGWQLPDGTLERPIPGNRLSPFGGTTNNSPIVSITSPTNGASFTAPATITINANASDSDGSITKVEFYQGASKLGEDLTSPYSFMWNNVPTGNYSLTAKAYDNGGAVSTSSTVNISVTGGAGGCTASGTILREYWANTSGGSLSGVPVNTTPTSTSQLTLFEGPSNVAANYGDRIRGYICPPSSGNYIFYIASNDNSELWLSTDDNPSNKVKIASVTGYTLSRQWAKYSTQQSSPINLIAGNKYYIESIHIQNGGTDNIAVGWQLPGGTLERPIPGNRLSPFEQTTNELPIVSITSPTNGASFTAPATITINVNASDSDGSITKVEFYQGSSKLGEDLSSPYSYTWNNVPAGNYSLTAKAYDNGGAVSTSSAVNISVTGGSGGGCTASGTILREYWANTSGSSLSGVPVNTAPTSISQLNILEGPSNVANNYGDRIRGYICPPATGNYTFWIASNDNSELWLSTDDNPANKIKIASVTGYTSPRQWDKYSSQQSAPVNLVAGNRYYIESIHIQNGGSDNIAVGWQLPGGTLERPIPGNRLSPFGGTTNNSPIVSITSPTNGASFTAPATITIDATASDSDGSITKVEFYQGASKLGEDLTSPYSFTWNNVAAGNYSLTAKAYDNGGAVSTSSAVSIFVTDGSGGGCTASGTILREYWANTSGSSLSGVPVNGTPTSTSQLTLFEGPSNFAKNYGDRIRGYICPPSSGSYIFWIASNDNSELWLSTDDNSSNKVKIASVTGYTSPRQWDKYNSQQSAPVSLVAGNRYYIESIHIQNGGSDNIAVGWQLPGGTLERPIPGNRLSPFEGGSNNGPTVSITDPMNDDSFIAPAYINIDAIASDPDGTIMKVEFYQGTTLLGEDLTSPYNYFWTNVPSGNYSLTAKAYDNEGAVTTSSAVNIVVYNDNPGGSCTASGTILREYWDGVQGNNVSQIPTQLPPTSTNQLSIFEEPSNTGTNYGTRIRGYVCVPTTGSYIFWIASNDDGELWLSSDDNPDNKTRIAFVSEFTNPRQWDKYSTQQSSPVNLVAGQLYYIEALHKQGAGSDNFAVGWQLPDGTLERPIPGNRLSPYQPTQKLSVNSVVLSSEQADTSENITVKAFPNPIHKGMVTLSIEGYDHTKHKVYVQVMDMNGKPVHSDKLSCDLSCSRTIINIDERFTPGTYLINVTVDEKRFSERLIVE